jgi:hypothetical protein
VVEGRNVHLLQLDSHRHDANLANETRRKLVPKEIIDLKGGLVQGTFPQGFAPNLLHTFGIFNFET